MAHERDEATWRRALRRAALPDALEAQFALTQSAPNQISYCLICRDAQGRKIGDDRDYDLLKAVISPLENLCNCEDAPFSATLNLETDQLVFKSGK